jgi:hypothetical protein
MNITNQGGKALKELLYDESIVIRPSDKSSGMVILNRSEWKGKNPIYFEVITIIPFDILYRRAYFVMHTFLVVFVINFTF